MADSISSLPLYEKVSHKSFILRTVDLTILGLLFSLLVYRIIYINQYDNVWIVAFLCESCFCFVWLLVTIIKWSPADYKTYPDRLHERVRELPPVDMFVTTADPVMEPPIITVNTVLSLLAVNYPANKLACYVSDDGCSPIIYFSLREASRFAKIWVPFCKKHNVQIRAPFRYFSNPPIHPEGSDSGQFEEDWKNMKVEYEKLSRKLEVVAENSYWLDADEDFAAFANINPRDHATIIKVIRENNGGVGEDTEVPHLVYVSREKSPMHPHHYKAGAMNVLVRVSGLMTNAPYMLNVDCDMYVNNPDVLRQGMCLFLGSKTQNEYAFVQSPQLFYDTFGDEIVVLQTYIGRGMVGIDGPIYAGSGGIHRRRIIYGLSPHHLDDDGNLSSIAKVELLGEGKLEREYGDCKEMVKSAVEALRGKSTPQNDLTISLEAAHRVGACDYEYTTNWGKTIGWLYGSTTEDANTSVSIHSKGWKSLYNSPDPPAFLGCMPAGGPAVMGQQRRWATGLLEVLFNKQSPVIGMLYRKLGFRTGLCYLYLFIWGIRSIPELCYSLLPAYCILHNSAFLPKGFCFFAGAMLKHSRCTCGDAFPLQSLGIHKSWFTHSKLARHSIIRENKDDMRVAIQHSRHYT
ncbi:PREDICTED: cellulose synthase-like protein B4 isoform X2 [Tarenaya hassleriana]|uniref:cellulose synthase-like protein B4 isoform X2 n=1 Tax=Tarenaya hassleriana TaxID=28532 RepID=UPI00053C2E8F|nr:PREDICTED: cellulose synthase-like protein B4 isoform X2 [Tarenaya hassleriana]